MGHAQDETMDIPNQDEGQPVTPPDTVCSPDSEATSPQWETRVSQVAHAEAASDSSANWETLAANGDLAPGQVLFGRYRVVRLLGRGGMGAVWLVHHLELDRERALKFILGGSIGLDSQARSRFQREAKILARISEHRNAVSVHDARLMSGELAYIDMEYVKGRSLDQYLIKGQPMPLDWTARILAQLCDVLQYAHDNQIIHRDLKPTNLMLVDGFPEGQEFLKVLDFGIGKIVNCETEEGDPHTMTGAFMGTPPYTSPEQAEGLAEPRSDLYSVGVILYEFLSGYRPFKGSPVHMITQTIGATPPPMQSVNPDASVPPEVERVVMRCLAKKPEDRPSSARELAEEFRRAVESSVPVAVSKTEPRPEKVATRTPRALVYAAGAMLAGLMVIGAILWMAKGKKATPESPTEEIGKRESDSGIPPKPVDKGSSKSTESAAESPPILASKVEAILSRHCRSCHGVEFLGGPFDVLDRAALLAQPEGDPAPLVTPGSPDRSRLWIIAGHPHPKADSKPPLAKADLDLLERWIKSGAESPAIESRPIRTVKADLAAVAEHLKKTAEADRPFQRYFSLASLNNNRQLPPRTLRQARAALSKSLNSLSWQPGLVVPRAIDSAELIYAIDLREFGWDKSRAWERLLRDYPYGVSYETVQDESMSSQAKDVHKLSGTEIPLIRADWFIATATRPPLYHAILELPKQIAELEKLLDVNARADFLGDDLVRAASAANPHAMVPRIIDNYMPVTRAFWRTYDVRTKNGPGDIFSAPLGPDFEGHPFPQAAFRPDAESVLFSLPNALHGYMLTDGEGKRVDAAPTDLLRDPLKTSGTEAVVTGLSCLACHRTGVKRFFDQLSTQATLQGEARVKLGGLMPKSDELEGVLKRQEDRFTAALEVVIAPFLKTGDDAKTPIKAFPEPIGPIARFYARDLRLEDIAAELGLEDSSTLASDLGRIEGVPEFSALAQGKSISRAQWTEAFDRVVLAFKLGTIKKIYGGKPD